MNKMNLLALAVGLTLTTTAFGGVVTIGGFKFDEKNTVTSAVIAEGPAGLKDHSSSRFGRFSEEYVTNPASRSNDFERFDRSKSIARLVGRTNKGKGHDYARFIVLPNAHEAPPTPNIDRCAVELAWAEGQGLSNGPGADFVVFEHGGWNGFEVAVRKAGSTEFSNYRYQFPKSKDIIHDVNAVPFDLADFGLPEGEMITAIRIRNIFNSKAAAGPDKVDAASGQGKVLYPNDPGYDSAFVLRAKPDGVEFPEGALNAELVYVAALHDVQAVKISEPPAPAPVPVAPAEEPKATNNRAATKR